MSRRARALPVAPPPAPAAVAVAVGAWPARIRRWLGPALIALTGLAMTLWTWGTWADPLVDLGRELYVPWRLLAGDALYRDVAYFNGPLSPYWNALWFLVLGPSFRTLFVANLALVAVVTWLLWRLLRPVASVVATTAACLTLWLVFACNQLMWVSIFNWIAPYSHELTHGIALGLGALVCLQRHQHGGRSRWLLAAGVCAGLAFLTKPETFVALAAALLTGLVLGWRVQRAPVRALVRRGVVVVAAGSAVVALALGALLLKLTAAEALAGVLGGWRHVLNPALHSMRFYRDCMGTYDLERTLRSAWLWSVSLGVALGPAALLTWLVRSSSRPLHRTLALGLLVANVALIEWVQVRWARLPQLLPLLLLALWAREALRACRAPDGMRAVQRATLAAFALVLLAKMLLSARVDHYGFGLAMPATLLGVVALLDWLPRWLARGSGAPLLFQAAAAPVVALAVVGLLGESQAWLERKTVTVGSGADAVTTDSRGRQVADVMAAIRRVRQPGATLAVLPEGATLNFWLGMRNPTPFINLMPPEVAMFGAEPIVAAYQRTPPDLVVLAHKDTTEYGPHFFGTDYLKEFGPWLRERYRVELSVGAPPFVDQNFGMVLLVRK